VHHQPIEPLVTVARWKEGTLTVWEATQWLNGARKVYSDSFGLPEEAVRVLSRYVGGGFGAKARSWLHGVLTAAAARRVQRPVSLVLTRAQMFTLAGRRPRTMQRVTVAAERDGLLTAILHETTTETSQVTDFVEHAGKLTTDLYACPNVEVRHRLARLDLSSPAHTRCPGVAPGLFALESALDELADVIGIDPVDLRRRNYAAVHPHSGRPWSSKHLDDCYTRGMELIGWPERPPRPRERRDGETFVGFGMATAAYTANRIGCHADARLFADGSVSIALASHDMGTGTATVLAQVAADRLGVSINRVAIELGDSSLPRAPASYSSLTVPSASPAVMGVAERLLDQLTHLAATDQRSPVYGCDGAAAVDGAIHACGGTLTFAELLGATGRSEVSATFFSAPGAEHETYSFGTFGAVFAKVRVDPDLGTVRLVRLAGCYDVGRVLNEKTARSQLIGGIVWGVGMALTEETLVDTRTARYVTRNLADYRIPVNADIPDIDVEILDEPDPHISGVGAKGLGEISTSGTAAAIANAVFNACGRRIRVLPIGPASLLAASSST
jgi:xanthine dehydrogenase YagR molybdenum-binding subunit